MSNITLFGRSVRAGDLVPKVFSGLIATTIKKLMELHAGIAPDQFQSNGLWAVHQFRVVLPGDTMAYRVIVAPANAPISIGGVPADEHFMEPLKPVDALQAPHQNAAE